MNNLIPIRSGQLAGEAVQTINARDLHKFLEVHRDFSNWIKGRIDEYGFEEGKDFRSILSKSSDHFSPKRVKNGRGRPSIDYHLSIDMAKELAMVEKNDKGRQARRYFIECERRAKAAAAPAPGAIPGPAYLPACDSSAMTEAFLAECTMVAPGERIQAYLLYNAFVTWCRSQGFASIPSSIMFSKAVGRRFSRMKANVYYWLSLALRPAGAPSTSFRAAPAALPAADAAFFRQASRLSSDFYDVFRDALVRCDELYRDHRALLRRHFPRAEHDHDVAELLRNFEGSGLSMIETADDAFNAALRQMRSAERVYRLAVRDRA